MLHLLENRNRFLFWILEINKSFIQENSTDFFFQVKERCICMDPALMNVKMKQHFRLCKGEQTERNWVSCSQPDEGYKLSCHRKRLKLSVQVISLKKTTESLPYFRVTNSVSLSPLIKRIHAVVFCDLLQCFALQGLTSLPGACCFTIHSQTSTLLPTEYSVLLLGAFKVCEWTVGLIPITRSFGIFSTTTCGQTYLL